MEIFLLCGIENWYANDAIWEESLVLNEKSFQPNNTKTKRKKTNQLLMKRACKKNGNLDVIYRAFIQTHNDLAHAICSHCN